MNNFTIKIGRSNTKLCILSFLNAKFNKNLVLFATFLFMSIGLVFAQQPAANLDQLRNGSAASPNDPGQWVNGNLGAQNSHYSEGFSSAYRAIMTNMPSSTVVTLTLEYDVKHSNRHALDYLTYYDRIEPHVASYGHTKEEIDPTIGTSFTEGIGFTNFTIPVPPVLNSPIAAQPVDSYNDLSGVEKLMTIWNGTITNITYGPTADLSQSNEPQQIIVTFTTGSAGDVLLAWGGHIASRHDWGSDGGGIPRSAGGISGSPYHMRLISWNLNNLGNQDRSLSADAIAAPPECEASGAELVCADEENIYSVITAGATNPTYTWEILSNTSGASFVDVPTNADTSVNVNSGNSSGTYIVKVTVDADEGTVFCQVEVTVNKPTVTFTAPADLCLDSGVQAGLGGGSPQGGVYSGAGVTDDGNGMTYSFDPTAAGVGVHTITYDYSDGNGCDGSASDDVTIDSPVDAGNDNDDAQCDLETVSLNSYLSGDADTNGTWEQIGGPNNLDISDPDNVNVSGEQGIYTFEYTVVSELGICPSDFMVLELTLDQSVDAGDDNGDQFCGANPGVNLFSYLSNGADETGGWIQIGGLETLDLSNASSVDFPDKGAGQYTFRYTVASAFGVCGTSEMELIIDVDSVSNPGADGSLTICVGDIVTEDQLFGALTGLPDAGGSWSPELAGAGTYTYSIESEGGICGIEESQVVVTEQVIEIIASDAICGELSDFGFYSVDVTTNGGALVSDYGTATDNGGNSWTITNIPNGQNVTVTVTTDLECEASLEIVAPECACIALDYEYTDVSCYGLDDGTITVNFVPDGATVTINGQPYDANMLYAPGSYTIIAFYEGVDIDECIIEEKINIEEPDLVNINAVGTDVTCYGANDGTITVSNLSDGAIYTIKKNGIGADLSGQTYFGPGLYIVKAFLPQNVPSSGMNDGGNRSYDPCESIVIVNIEQPAPLACKLFTGFGTKIDCKNSENNWIAAKTVGQGQITFTWSLSPKSISNGWGIVDDTAGNVIEIIPGTGSATYYLSIQDETGCISECSIDVTSKCSDNKSMNVTLYPNPVKDILNVKFDDKVDSDVTIEVYNLVGTKMFANTYSNNGKRGANDMKIDFSRFPSHVYYVKVITKKGTIIKKVVLDK